MPYDYAVALFLKMLITQPLPLSRAVKMKRYDTALCLFEDMLQRYVNYSFTIAILLLFVASAIHVLILYYLS